MPYVENVGDFFFKCGSEHCRRGRRDCIICHYAAVMFSVLWFQSHVKKKFFVVGNYECRLFCS
jgi:hypothetical protein